MADTNDRLARRAAGGDITAARELLGRLEAKQGIESVTLPKEAFDLALEALRAASDSFVHYERMEPGEDGLLAAGLAKIAEWALTDPSCDWKAPLETLRRRATIRTCRHCGLEIYDARNVSGAESADWATARGRFRDDFGCDDSPDTCEEGVGSHEPEDED